MTLIVYPCGPNRGDLLRYTLRSLAEAVGDGERPRLALIGAIPEYIDRRTLTVCSPMLQRSDPFANVWRAWEVAARLDVEREWWWFNDDFMLTGPLDTVLVDTHRGSLERFCTDLARRGDVAMYRRRAQAALRVLRGAGYASPYNWEAHTPLRAAAALVHRVQWLAEDAGVAPDSLAVRTVMATLDEREGALVADPKSDRAGPPYLPYPLASLGPRAWRGPTGAMVRERFNAPSPWER